jgi:nitrogen fixation protein NifU and related proteins
VTTQQLYNDDILAEAKARHGHGRLAEPDVTATCDNPLCGDRVTVDLRLAGDRISELAQTTRGCILTQAAASVIGRHLTGAPFEDLHRAATEIRRLLAGDDSEPTWPELAMFAPVRAVKSRHECVLLPFDAVAVALSKEAR